jgi:hypothetical protein
MYTKLWTDNKGRSDGKLWRMHSPRRNLNLGSSVTQRHREHHHIELQYYAQLNHHSRALLTSTAEVEPTCHTYRYRKITVEPRNGESQKLGFLHNPNRAMAATNRG